MSAAARHVRVAVSATLTLFAVACASGPREARPAQQAAHGSADGVQAQAPPYGDPAKAQSAGYPESADAKPGQPAPPPPSSPTTTSPQGGAQPIAPGRSTALARAGSDFDAAQRELDVAAGDCRNACRALASMDRAAGHLCELAQASEETRRCDDARRRVLSARERVKQTCGGCPGGPSVERNDPIPSTR